MSSSCNALREYGIVITAVCFIFLAGGCSAELHGEDAHGGHDHAEAAAPQQETGHEDHDAHDDHAAEEAPGHEGHNHEEAGDMDQPVETLFAQRCEHDMPTHACEECRYEVGVVKVPAELISRGLVTANRVQTRNFDAEIILTGEIRFDAAKVAHLGPRATGIVKRVMVDLGQRVKAGQRLAELESPPLAEAQSALLEAAAAQRLARTALDRQKALRESNITSEREYLEAQQSYESATIRRASARHRLRRLGMGDAEIDALDKAGHSAATGMLSITAPFAGTVLELHAVRGEMAQPGEDMLLLGDMDRLWIWVDVYEHQLAAIRSAMGDDGLPATVSVRAFPQQRFSGVLDVLDGVMDEATRTIKARIVLDNPGGLLRPGMFATVALGLDRSGGRMAVTEASVLQDGEDRFVFVRHDGDYFVRRRVRTGRRSDGVVEITNGLQPGQEVVSGGAFLLKSDVLRSKMGEGCAH